MSLSLSSSGGEGRRLGPATSPGLLDDGQSVGAIVAECGEKVERDEKAERIEEVGRVNAGNELRFVAS